MKCIPATGKQDLINCIWVYAYANGIVEAEGLEMFKTVFAGTNGMVISLGNFPSEKIHLVGWMSGNYP
jgi:hypothetical protein